jgi:mono/diheme cytochrome c family protein
LFITSAAAQTTTIEIREQLTGRQLFEKEWKWTEPSKPSSIVSDEAVQPESLARDFESSGNNNLASFLIARCQPGLGRDLTGSEGQELSLGDGLGPMHNATSCAACHVGGGSSGVSQNVLLLTIEPRSDIVHRTRTGAETLRQFFPALLASDGTLQFEVVVHNRSTRSGYDSLRNHLAEFVPGGVSDEWFVPSKRTVEAIAHQPVLAGRFASIDYYLSQRNAPPLFGVGSFQHISRKKLAAIAEKQASESSGAITGRIAGVYGWRGQENSLTNFVAQACAVELGLAHGASHSMGSMTTQSFAQIDDPADPSYANPGVDLTSVELDALTEFVSSIPCPVERVDKNQKRSESFAGEKLFNSIGCNVCHVAEIYPVRGLFSDLLLHDMGPALQAPSPAALGALHSMAQTIVTPKFVVRSATERPSVPPGYGNSTLQRPIPESLPPPAQPQFPRGEPTDAAHLTWDWMQREWRTPPLWGIADTAPYLHDGRAETIEEAINWHGGESEAVTKRFLELNQAEKGKLLAFLATLRAPSP